MSTSTISTARKIADTLVEKCSQGENIAFINAHYSPEIVSVEAGEMPGMGREQRGLDAIIQKNQWWFDNHDIHSNSVEGPFMSGDDEFAVKFTSDVTFKPSGKRQTISELGFYKVQNDKIVREQFFYGGGCEAEVS